MTFTSKDLDGTEYCKYCGEDIDKPHDKRCPLLQKFEISLDTMAMKIPIAKLEEGRVNILKVLWTGGRIGARTEKATERLYYEIVADCIDHIDFLMAILNKQSSHLINYFHCRDLRSEIKKQLEHSKVLLDGCGFNKSRAEELIRSKEHDFEKGPPYPVYHPESDAPESTVYLWQIAVLIGVGIYLLYRFIL